MRREWIEIAKCSVYVFKSARSPSMRREWIEISLVCKYIFLLLWSPSMRREWIEISFVPPIIPVCVVSLHAEGVD